MASDPLYTLGNLAGSRLKERGIVDTRHRRNYAATTTGVHLDAMTEYFALAEGG